MTSTRREIKLPDVSGTEHAYELTLHPAGEGWSLLTTVSTVAGGPLGRMFDGLAKSGGLANVLDAEIDGTQLGQAFEDLAKNIVKEGGLDLIKSLLKYATRDREKVPQSFDTIYQGNYGELLAAVAWAVKENFGSVFRGPFDRLGKMTGR